MQPFAVTYPPHHGYGVTASIGQPWCPRYGTSTPRRCPGRRSPGRSSPTRPGKPHLDRSRVPSRSASSGGSPVQLRRCRLTTVHLPPGTPSTAPSWHRLVVIQHGSRAGVIVVAQRHQIRVHGRGETSRACAGRDGLPMIHTSRAPTRTPAAKATRQQHENEPAARPRPTDRPVGGARLRPPVTP
jgi:hypothetical protein